MERTLRLVALLRDAEEVKAPRGVPCEGKVVSFDNALAFLQRYLRFLRDLGPELASPQVTFHWTAEENFQSIVESNLRVPQADAADEGGVKKKHGAAFGRGIYTCPDYKMAKEDFSYGASATFACLALTGRQLVRHHGKGHGRSDSRGPDFDSVTGRLPGRNCCTWVFPASDQILPCFLVDEVAIPAAVAKLRQAIALIREAWPDANPQAPTALQTMEEAEEDDAATNRWRRSSERSSPGVTSNQAFDKQAEGRDDLPYGGDLQEAMRAQDRSAVKLLMALRDQNQNQVSQVISKGSRRWGAKKVEEFPRPPSQGGVSQKAGNLLQATEDYIIHQCNCVYDGRAQGIAEAIFDAFPDADVYRQRVEQGRPHDLPGTVSIHGRIVNFYSQLLPGRPADDAPPGGWSSARFVGAAKAVQDTRSSRLRWFQECLQALSRTLQRPSVAFPARIGCGLAGGRWPEYLAALNQFAQEHPDWRIAIYDLDDAPQGAQVPNFAPKADAAETAQRRSNRQTAGGSGFWNTATFEALRNGQWIAYSEAHQTDLRCALQREDDCTEVMVDSERRQALATLAEMGVCPRSLGSVDGEAASLIARLDNSSGPVNVNLAAIVSAADYGEESTAEGKTKVRLRLPAVREGELRLPADLDLGSCPTLKDCGRTLDAEQLQPDSTCGICLGELVSRRRCSVLQLHCGHSFHDSCLDRWFEERRRCPTCKRRFGHLVGNQPSVGTMSWRLDSRVRLAGHPDSFTIVLNFRFPSGWDSNGESYRGRSQQAYLPHDESGKLLLALFQLAFRRRVLFDLRVSATDQKYWPAFNIHLKTALAGGPERFGFPDDGYCQRVLEELRENGVTIAEL